jgi:Icc-related predicted phosphoesterase
MKIAIYSDLHLEHRGYNKKWLEDLKEPNIDLAVFAGDIMTWDSVPRCRDVLDVMSGFGRKVLYVPGNHEFYGNSFLTGYETIRYAASTCRSRNVKVVTTPYLKYRYRNINIACGTMWYPSLPISTFGEPSTGIFTDRGRAVRWSDFVAIGNSSNSDVASDIYRHNTEFTKGLKKEEPGGIDMVVTHMLPSEASTPIRFKDSLCNAFFVSAQDSEISRLKPQLWVHGHAHDTKDYFLGKTRVIANPCGYPGEYEESRYRGCVVEIKRE